MDLNPFLLVFHIQWCMKYLLEEINPNPNSDPTTMITPYPQSQTTNRYIQAIVPHPHVSITRNPLSADLYIQTLSRYPHIAITQNPQSRTTHRHIQTSSCYPQPKLHILILSMTRFSSGVSKKK